MNPMIQSSLGQLVYYTPYFTSCALQQSSDLGMKVLNLWLVWNIPLQDKSDWPVLEILSGNKTGVKSQTFPFISVNLTSGLYSEISHPTLHFPVSGSLPFQCVWEGDLSMLLSSQGFPWLGEVELEMKH